MAKENLYSIIYLLMDLKAAGISMKGLEKAKWNSDTLIYKKESEYEKYSKITVNKVKYEVNGSPKKIRKEIVIVKYYRDNTKALALEKRYLIIDDVISTQYTREILNEDESF